MIIKTPLWEHQKTMLDFALSRINDKGYAWWLAGCSTGKTLAAYQYIKEMGYKKVLVITTKAGAQSAWLEDARKHVEGLKVVTPVGESREDKRDMLRSVGDGVFVINYESSWRIIDDIQKHKFDFILTDESHKIKAHNSTQSLRIAEIAANIPHRLAMTGTGFDERPTDVYGQVRYLSPEKERGKRYHSAIFGTWTRFFDRYVDYIRHNNIPLIKGYKNQAELREIINPFTLYVDSEKVLTLPDVVDIERSIPMTPKIAKAYHDMEKDFVVRFGGDVLIADNVLEQAIRLHQITSGYYPNEDGLATPIVEDKDNPKLQATIDILDEIGGKPTVIFTRFREDVAILKRNLEENGYGVRLLTGSVNQQMDWQHNGAGQILIANIAAGGEAVDLTRARYCIYYSIGHSRSSYIQSLARIRRKGADLAHPVTYYHLIMEKSIDVAIRRAMGKKGEFADYLKDGLVNCT